MKRYHVTTFGCQMNAHDSERIKGMLEELGLGEASSPEHADVIVLNTCTIRESRAVEVAKNHSPAGSHPPVEEHPDRAADSPIQAA